MMYRPLLTLAASSLLIACVSHPAQELRPFERQSAAALGEAWRKSGLPPATQDGCDVARFSIQTPSASDYGVSCSSTPEASAGCTNWTSDGRWFGSGPLYPVVVISPDWTIEPGIIIHELTHARIYCSGLGKAGDPYDATHSDPRFWAAAGGSTSVQARALAILAAQSPPLLPK